MEKRKKNKLKRLCLRAAASAILGFSAAWWGIPGGYAQRGYNAVGGEHLLILAAVLFPFLLSPALWRR